MMTKGGLPGYLMLVLLLPAAPVVVAEEAPFTYSDDWSLVSAPPPPGPYQAVNIDPRVPGQDAIPPISTGAESFHGWEQLPAGIETNPPAAGRPSIPPTPSEEVIPHSVPGEYRPAPVPGAYQERIPRPSDYRFPEPTGMQSPEHTTYGNMPPSGYYKSPAVQMEQEVPPPPVYDAMTGESDGLYGRPPGH
jgi:hypothetical protein